MKGLLLACLSLLILRLHSWCLQSSTALGSSTITSIKYSPDRSVYAVIASNKVKIFSANNHRPLFTVTPAGNPSDIAFTPNNTLLAVAQFGSAIEFFNMTAAYAKVPALTIASGHGNSATAAVNIDFSPDSLHLLSCGGVNNKANLWTLANTASPTSTWTILGILDCALSSALLPAVTTSSNKV